MHVCTSHTCICRYFALYWRSRPAGVVIAINRCNTLPQATRHCKKNKIIKNTLDYSHVAAFHFKCNGSFLAHIHTAHIHKTDEKCALLAEMTSFSQFLHTSSS